VPMSADLAFDQQDRVIAALRRAVAEAASPRGSASAVPR